MWNWTTFIFAVIALIIIIFVPVIIRILKSKKNQQTDKSDSWLSKDYSSEAIFYDGNEKEFQESGKFFNPSDDKPPRCRSCRGTKLKFYLANGSRFWHCMSCGRQSGNAASFDLENSIPAPHQDPFYKEGSQDQQNRKEESIEFAAFAPETIDKDTNFILDIWAFLPHQYSSVVKTAQQVKRDQLVGRKSGIPVYRGEILSISVYIKNLEVYDPVDTIIWNGFQTNASFIIHVPSTATGSSYPGTATICYNGLLIANLSFLLNKFENSIWGTNNIINHNSHTLYPKTAFASYASENRDEVLSRVQGMNKVAPNLDIFVDIISLRSGDNWQEKLEEHVPTKDRFYLFWSKEAAQSDWVTREWKLALRRRGLEYIDPVPLEEPDHAPPPPELSKLHFSDSYVAYIKYYQLKKSHNSGEEFSF